MNNDFFDLLIQEHEQVKDILEQLEETDEFEVEKREQLFKELKSGLIPHLKAEEAAYYPRLIDEDQSKEQALEAAEEHHAAELILYELEKLSKKNERWGAKLSVFKYLRKWWNITFKRNRKNFLMQPEKCWTKTRLMTL